MLEAYVRHLPEVGTRLREASRAADWAAARKIVHRLRGTGGSYGFPRITEVAGECERAIGDDRERATASVERLLAVLSAVTGDD